MDSSSPSLRDQGLQALQAGNLDQAIDLLAKAVMKNDQDAEAKALLGIAYSQKGIHQQARRALQTAVELQPQNVAYRFNLAIVIERSGDIQGAVAAYRDLLQIQPQHEGARAKLQALSPQAHGMGGPSPVPPGAAPPGPPSMPAGAPPPQYGAPPPSPPGYGAPPPGAMPPPPGAVPPMGVAPSPYGSPLSGVPAPSGPPAGGPPPSGPFAPPPSPGMAPPGSMPPPPGAMPPPGQFGAPPGQYGAPPPGYGAPSTMQAPPGTVQCNSCQRFSKIGMTCEFCQAPLPPPVRLATPAPGVPPPGMVPGYGAPGYSAAPPDAFSIPQGFRDWFRCLTSPNEFFSEQFGADGLASPISYLLVVVLLSLVGTIPVMLMAGSAGGAAMGLPIVACVALCTWPMYIVGTFIWAGVVHLVCLMFRPQGNFSGTFRAASYATAPGVVLGVLASLSLIIFGGGTSGRSLPSSSAVPPAASVTRSAEAVPSRAALKSEAGMLAIQTFPPPSGGTPSSRRPDPEQIRQALQRLSGPSNAISTLINLVASIVYLVWLGIGVAHIHKLSTGAAIAVPIISIIAMIIIGVILVVVFSMLIFGAALGAAGGFRGR